MIYNDRGGLQRAVPPSSLPYSCPSSIMDGGTICKLIIAIILPPLGVFIQRGWGADLAINVVLTLMGYLPGIIHAVYLILKT